MVHPFGLVEKITASFKVPAYCIGEVKFVPYRTLLTLVQLLESKRRLFAYPFHACSSVLVVHRHRIRLAAPRKPFHRRDLRQWADDSC
jgi:hypothetical protein